MSTSTLQLPFSVDAFLDVFAIYNASFWPIAVALWAATAAAFVAHVAGRDQHRWICGVLVVHWAWAAIAYHAALFSRINPAAWLFAGSFLVEAGLLLDYGVVRRRLRFSRGRRVHEGVAYVLIAYGLLYPLIVLAGGHTYPRVPTFGVPCPTTIVTVGFLLLASERVPLILTIVPLFWTVVAGSAAFLLGMPADLALLVAGFALGLQTWPRHVILGWYTRWGTQYDERGAPLPGDEIVTDPETGYTLATTIPAAPTAIWPWLVQMGQDRGGFYTHEWIENLLGADIHNADRIVPALQRLAVGDTIRLTPDPYLGRPGQIMTVAGIEPQRALVFRQTLPNGAPATWALVLRPQGEGTTRLLSRRRGGRPSLFDRVMWPGYVFMDRGVLRGIRRRATTTVRRCQIQ
jgi:hypothetical protein